MSTFNISVGLFAVFILLNLMRIYRKYKDLGSAGEGRAVRKVSRADFDRSMAGASEAVDGGDFTGAIEILDDVLTRISKVSQKEFYGKAMGSRGDCYSQLAAKENDDEDFNRAEAAYRLAIRAFGQTDIASGQASVQSSLGNLYLESARRKDPAKNLELAIESFDEALKFFTAENQPEKHARIQVGLGRARSELAGIQDRRENLIHSMKAYGEALKVYRSDKNPMQHALILVNLGNAFFEFSQVQEVDRFLARSSQAYSQALKHISAEEHPDLHGKILSYLQEVKAHAAKIPSPDPVPKGAGDAE